MRKEFSLSNDKATINFTAKYCDNYETLLESDGFNHQSLSSSNKPRSNGSTPNSPLKRGNGDRCGAVT